MDHLPARHPDLDDATKARAGRWTTRWPACTRPRAAAGARPVRSRPTVTRSGHPTLRRKVLASRRFGCRAMIGAGGRLHAPGPPRADQALPPRRHAGRRRRAARGPGHRQIARLCARLRDCQRLYLADPRRSLQVGGTALVLAGSAINVVRRADDGSCRYAISLLDLDKPRTTSPSPHPLSLAIPPGAASSVTGANTSSGRGACGLVPSSLPRSLGTAVPILPTGADRERGQRAAPSRHGTSVVTAGTPWS